ncbi:hypothetical protein D9613_000336 [Agrocybe pediades]|uniref:SAM domain-containing protein n=1 Tax=Agrocybe pediades TaxID=84607 RepID=A0A8H4R118_9AGAR|nr:hypothetical protein D9613_000336 [Agrocybe pediades]
MSTIETTPQPIVATEDVNKTPASGQANGATPASETTPAVPAANIEGFDRWIKDFQKYEGILNGITKATSNTKFKDELGTIEQWFKLLTEPEKTATLYSLIQGSTQEQLKFFGATIQTLIIPEEVKPVTPAVASAGKPKLGKLSFRPPSLNLPDLGSPATPTPVTAKESASDEQTHVEMLAQAAADRGAQPGAIQDTSGANWTNLGNTPVVPLFQKDSKDASKPSAASNAASLPGFSGINPYTLNMLANAGLSPEAQLLAAQLVMSGLVQPTGLSAQGSAKTKKPPVPTNWRTPSSARFPASALRSSGLRPSSGLKSAGLKSSGLAAPGTPLSAMESPREEDFDPEMLKDIPAWLRTLRLHKYTQCFDGLTWQEMVVLDDATLEAKGVAALGARRRLLRTFEHVRKRMGMEEPSSATPTTTTMPTGAAFKAAPEVDRVPHSALPRSKLSINSPIFTPTWEAGKLPTSASPAVKAEATDAAPAAAAAAE